jgi:hypothetical protein
MKKIFWRSFLPVLVALMAACDVTDLQPANIVSESLAFGTAANCENSVIGMYDAAQSGFYNNAETTDRGYIFGAAHVQQGDMRGEDFTLVNVFYDFTYRATYTTTTANNVNYWENGWRAINLANLVIEGVQKAGEAGVLTAAAAAAYEGEARVIRAITYHTLLVHFARPYLDANGTKAGLPILTKGNNSFESAGEVVLTSRSSVADVYALILEDLNFAEANLPDTRADQMKVTRATKGAAIALKTRINLHKGDWANVISEANKIVPADLTTASAIGAYKLGNSVETPWNDNKSTESVFSMEASSTDAYDVNSAVPRMMGSPDPAIGARGEYIISPIIWDKTFWHADDLRRTLLVKTYNGRKYGHKFRDYKQYTDYIPVIRYAEVILNLAEAEARTTAKSARALALLNAIRNRAIPTPVPPATTTMVPYVITDFSNGKALTQAILDERRIELLGEGERWSDIHRNVLDSDFTTNGIPAKMSITDVAGAYVIGATPVTAIAAIPYDDHRFLWPFPQTETTRNPTLAAEQNPGY